MSRTHAWIDILWRVRKHDGEVCDERVFLDDPISADQELRECRADGWVCGLTRHEIPIPSADDPAFSHKTKGTQ